MAVDHCRIGSLEIIDVTNERDTVDHCRIGSLEILHRQTEQ